MFNLQVTSTTMELLPLVCLCLLTRSGTTFAEEGSKVIYVEEGNDVTLPCSLSTKEDIESNRFDWTKDGQKEVFLYDAGKHYNNGRAGQDEQFEGRVSHFPDELKHGDASIKVRNTRVSDSGNYICAFPRLQPNQTFHIRLVVVVGLKDRSAEKIIGFFTESPTGLFVGTVLCVLIGGVVFLILIACYCRRRSTQNAQRGSQT